MLKLQKANWFVAKAIFLRKVEMDLVFKAVCNFCRDYPVGISGGLKAGDKRALEVKAHLKVLTEYFQSFCDKNFKEKYTVTYAKGAGAFPRIPYVVVRPEGQETSDGVYVSMCFDKNGKGAVFGCAQSVTNPRPNFEVVIRKSKGKSPVIDVDGVKKETKFNNSYANPKEILKEEFDEQLVLEHLKASLKLCKEYLNKDVLDVVEDSRETDSMLFSTDALKKDLNKARFVYSENLPAAFCAALSAKPFLILTGLSGSGKTKLAQVFANWISATKKQMKLVAVGADWTSNENLLGYPDALKTKSYRKPDNGMLDLILNAQSDSESPYFLILDEMNLSHVERYFADFLSAMESDKPIFLHDDTGEDWDGVPAKLKIPKNLFVIGTVNIDETTYMFSPKVLDRANAIEFRVTDDEMQKFMENPVKPDLDAIAGKGSQYARAFVQQASLTNVELEDDVKGKVSSVLMKFFPVLKKDGAEFGYRSANEICRFIYFHKLLSGEDWKFEQAMDAAIMQKLLPKLHGSKKKLMPVLESLMRLCFNDEVLKNDKEVISDEIITEANARYWSSLEKLGRMRKRLQDHGFTSFAEA
jgi:5-methylcytosine-specific restriction enzyme B